MYRIKRTDTFIKTAKKFFKKHPQLSGNFRDIILKLQANPFDPSLKTHKLKGKLKDKYGVSITYQYRITIGIQTNENEVILMDIGSHDEVY